MGAVTQVTTSTFPSEVLESKVPVVVDFFTTWCGPCQMLAPILEKFAQENSGKVKIVKIDAEAEPELSTNYAIGAFPTLLLIKDGREAARKLGALPASALKQWLDPHMGSPA
jgi:thioredoxin 1